MLVFDDKQAPAFYPLCLTRSVGDLRCGILKLRQRIQAMFESEDSEVWVEPRLVGLYRERHPDWKVNSTLGKGSIAVNSRLRSDPAQLARIAQLAEGECFVWQDQLVAFRASEDHPVLPELRDLIGLGYQAETTEISLYRGLPDLIHDNERLLRLDFEQFFYDQDNYFETEPGVTTLHPYNIWIAEDVELKPGVVLDASAGPIVIDEGARIMPNAVLIGPLYIGKRSVVKAGAKIYGPSSIGPVCKIGGEIEGTIMQAYSNKQHDGFLGHSYIGEWVNLGADTNNSDLKNTYKPVSYYSYPERIKVDSGTIFLGAAIGDHAKLGINTTLNTGLVIGIGSNLWGPELLTDFIPDFSWGTASHLDKYRWDDFCATATLVKQRRGLSLSNAEKQVLHDIHNHTEVTP